MPKNRLIEIQLDPVQLTNCMNQLNYVQSLLLPFSLNLTVEERQRYGSINEQNKLLVGKVLDLSKTMPNLASPDVNWTEYDEHWTSRSGFAQVEALCNAIIEICSDARILHDYALYQNALVDYNYSKYKAESTQGAGGHHLKVEEIKQFFPNPSGNNKTKDATQ